MARTVTIPPLAPTYVEALIRAAKAHSLNLKDAAHGSCFAHCRGSSLDTAGKLDAIAMVLERALVHRAR